jgi:hypothetical protein
MSPFPVDVIYTWCGSPKSQHCGLNRDLAFSIKSVRANMPWIRYIWVVVPDGSTLDLGGGVKIVFESSFVPRKYLPVVFNSNVIESWLWRIEGLSEHFVYSCDDMYVGRPARLEDFFAAGGRPITRLYSGPPDYPAKTDSPIPYVQMWSAAVREYGMHYTRIQHQMLPYRKSHMARFYKQYKAAVDEASKNKMRAGAADFNLLRFTSALSVMHGLAVVLVTEDDYDFFTESDDAGRIRRILKIKPQFFCINNNFDANKKAYNMLTAYFGPATLKA